MLLRLIAARELYAGEILEALANTPFATQEGTLYPLLSKMRRDGYLEYQWRESAAGPPRKYYSLTTRGCEQLRAAEHYWQSIIRSIKSTGRGT
jgi:PadR family transcriptional regulator PadR